MNYKLPPGAVSRKAFAALLGRANTVSLYKWELDGAFCPDGYSGSRAFYYPDVAVARFWSSRPGRERMRRLKRARVLQQGLDRRHVT